MRYLASDLGPSRIRVNAISAGPVKTASARAIRDFQRSGDGRANARRSGAIPIQPKSETPPYFWPAISRAA